MTDECTGKKSVIERLCNGNNKSVETYECDAGCEDGACIYPKKGCTDTDSDVFLKGSVNVTNPDGTVTAFEDRCDGQALIELGCNGFTRIETIVECESGCNDGACVPRADPCIGCDGECIEGICKEDIGSCKTNADCHDDDPCTLNTCSGICRTQKISGCNMDGRCVPYSARQGNAYCGPDGNISTQKSNGKECKRDYECITNVCEENRCSEGMLQKILNWFMKLFSS
ncbi:MAG: hypothetical protein HGA85_03630 [Nanoarchaeota archaeon]|nr:hypothetical protein [Nanoarchaeota archaeon]